MKSLSQISQEVNTTVTELASGRFEITSIHVSGESKTGTAGPNSVKAKAEVIHNTLISRVARISEAA